MQCRLSGTCLPDLRAAPIQGSVWFAVPTRRRNNKGHSAPLVERVRGARGQCASARTTSMVARAPLPNISYAHSITLGRARKAASPRHERARSTVAHVLYTLRG